MKRVGHGTSYDAKKAYFVSLMFFSLSDSLLELVNVTDPSKLPLEFEFMLSSTHAYQKSAKKYREPA